MQAIVQLPVKLGRRLITCRESQFHEQTLRTLYTVFVLF
jgi:hypothetical protein